MTTHKITLVKEQAKELIDNLNNKGRCAWFHSYDEYKFNFTCQEPQNNLVVTLTYGGNPEKIKRFVTLHDTTYVIPKYDELKDAAWNSIQIESDTFEYVEVFE
jgi:hypothetical protein